MTLAAGPLFMIDPAYSKDSKEEDTDKNNNMMPKNNNTFSAIKQIDAGVLNVGYAEAGPADSHPVILLHGWPPYDIYSYAEVSTQLAVKGYRVIVPYLRGLPKHHVLIVRYTKERSASRIGNRYYCLDGCNENSESQYLTLIPWMPKRP